MDDLSADLGGSLVDVPIKVAKGKKFKKFPPVSVKIKEKLESSNFLKDFQDVFADEALGEMPPNPKIDLILIIYPPNKPPCIVL